MHIYLQFAKALWLTTEKLFEIEEQEIKPMEVLQGFFCTSKM